VELPASREEEAQVKAGQSNWWAAGHPRLIAAPLWGHCRELEKMLE
jgi:hypothetical protein